MLSGLLQHNTLFAKNKSKLICIYSLAGEGQLHARLHCCDATATKALRSAAHRSCRSLVHDSAGWTPIKSVQTSIKKSNEEIANVLLVYNSGNLHSPQPVRIKLAPVHVRHSSNSTVIAIFLLYLGSFPAVNCAAV